MSSTTNVQNLLVNVFRPVYVYDALATKYVPKLEMSNIDTYFGNATRVLADRVGDASGNVYVGVGAGNDPTVSLAGCSNVTAVGTNAGHNISNVLNSVYLGYGAGNSAIHASNVIAIGYNAGGSGSNNIFIGSNTGSTTSSNILIGQGLTCVSSNQLNIGGVVYGDLSNRYVGIHAEPGVPFDVSGMARFRTNVGVNVVPTSYSLDVNGTFHVDAGVGEFILDGSSIRITDRMLVSRTSGSSSAKWDVSGTVTATEGFNSKNGTATVGASASVSIGTLRQGMLNVSVQDVSTTNANYAAKILYAPDATGATGPSSNSIVQNGSANIVISTSNIQISNSGMSSANYNWSITYFPISP